MSPAEDSRRLPALSSTAYSSPAAIGLGCSTFGREIDRAASFAMMEHARARGVRFFDTAESYAAGASETIVGEWLAEKDEATEIAVSTKTRPPYTAESVRQAALGSAARLRRRRIDVYFLHKPDTSAEDSNVLRTLDELVRAGLIGSIGASNFPADALRRVVERQRELGLAPVRYVQNNHNLALRDVDAPLLQLCAQYGMTLITYSPLGAGFLTGKHRNGVPAGTRFDLVPGHQNLYFNALAFRRLARLEAIAARVNRKPTELALAWALHQPGVAMVLVGGRTPAHLDQAFAARACNEPALLAELERE